MFMGMPGEKPPSRWGKFRESLHRLKCRLLRRNPNPVPWAPDTDSTANSTTAITEIKMEDKK